MFVQKEPKIGRGLFGVPHLYALCMSDSISFVYLCIKSRRTDSAGRIGPGIACLSTLLEYQYIKHECSITELQLTYLFHEKRPMSSTISLPNAHHCSTSNHSALTHFHRTEGLQLPWERSATELEAEQQSTVEVREI